MFRIAIIIFLLTLFCSAQKKEIKKVEKKEAKSEESIEIKEPSFELLTKEDGKALIKAADFKRKEYTIIAKYIHKKYVEPTKKSIPKLEKQLNILKDRFAIAKTDIQKKKVKKDYLQVAADLEVAKMWPKYHKVYITKESSYQKRDSETYGKAKKLLKEYEKRYFELKKTAFPRIKSNFYTKYSEEIKKFRKANGIVNEKQASKK